MSRSDTKPVRISEIKIPNKNELNEGKLRSLENSPDSLESLLQSKSDPIRLEGQYPPYRVTSGRHRVYLAYQRGIGVIPASVESY
jgi:hypothetical protein